MYKKVCILTMLLLAALSLTAQKSDSAAVRFGMRAGTTVAAGFGRSDALMWAAPHVDWRVSDRLQVSGGMLAAGSLMPGGYGLQGLGTRSLAPRRQGTQLVGAWARADYKASERLWLWASVARLEGRLQPLWLDGAIPIGVTALSGGLEWTLSEGSILEMHFHFVYDNMMGGRE